MSNALFVAVALVCAPFLAKAQVQVDAALRPFQPSGDLTGTLVSTGDDDMESLMNRWVAIFKKAHPDVKVQVDVGTSATAPGDLAAGKAEISYVGRVMLEREAALVTNSWGHEATAITVSGGTYADKEKTHAEMVWVNSDNPLQSLTLAQLKAVFGAESTEVTTWGELGLTGEWADKPVHAIRNSSIGASEFFKATVLEGGEWRKAITVKTNVQDVTNAVAQDPLAIGLGGLGYGAGLKIRPLAIALATGSEPVKPTLENAANRSYPLARLVYIYVNRAPGRPLAPIVKEFLRAVLSKDGQEAALEDGYLPLSAKMVMAELGKLN